MAAKLTGKFLLREVNARIRGMSDRFGLENGLYSLLCECGSEDCRERVEVPASVYEEARRRARFFLAQGHVLGG